VAKSRLKCLEALENGTFDLILSDSHGHDFTGLEILHLIRKQLPLIPFIFLSGSFDDSDTDMLKAEGATDCILKEDLDALPLAILRAVSARKEQPPYP
jgi:CheY-like chemotaxis protein